MKKWTVVVEITDDGDPVPMSRQEIGDLVMKDCPAGIGFQVFEIVEAPYGPTGVILIDILTARAKKTP